MPTPRLSPLPFLLAGTSVEEARGGAAGSTVVGAGGGVVAGSVATEVDDEEVFVGSVETGVDTEVAEAGPFSTWTDVGALVGWVNSNEDNADSDAAGWAGSAEDDGTSGAGAGLSVDAATTGVVETAALGTLVTRTSVVVE
jgi:hypothetical protein